VEILGELGCELEILGDLETKPLRRHWINKGQKGKRAKGQKGKRAKGKES
jgi:hypothetical protein